MTELRPKSQWRWWTYTTKDPGSMLGVDATAVCFSDGEAWTEAYYAPRLVQRVLDNPAETIQKLINDLEQFKGERG